jgi:hypothetical protein
MRKKGLLLLLLALTAVMAWGDVIVGWNFPSTSADFVADSGIAANAAKTISIVGAVLVPATTGTNPTPYAFTTGTGGAGDWAISANNWVDGIDTKYWLIEFSTSNCTSLTVSSKQKGSNTGPKNFKLQYRIGSAGTWTDVSGATIVVANDAFNNGVLNNVSLPVACENQTSLYLRWVVTTTNAINGTLGTSGTDRLDDIVISGAYAPVSPSLTPSPATRDFTNQLVGSTSSYLSYQLSGTNLTGAPGNIAVTAPTGFSVCLTADGTYTSSVNVPYSGATLDATTVYVKFSPSAVQTYSGNITNVGGGASANVAVSGNGIGEYYFIASDELNSLSSWWSNSDGSGTHPASFTANNQIFHAISSENWAMDGWTVSGTNSKVIIGDGTSATASYLFGTINATVDVSNNAFLALFGTVPTFGTLGSTSTVCYAETSTTTTYTIPSMTYGNLEIVNGRKALATGTFNVLGNMTVDNAGLTAPETPYAYVYLSGHYTQMGWVDYYTDQKFTLTTVGNGDQIIYSEISPISFYQFISTKTAGSLSLASGYTTIQVTSNVRLDFTGSARFYDNGNTIRIGGNAPANANLGVNGDSDCYSFTGTVQLNALGTSTCSIRNTYNGSAAICAPLNNLEFIGTSTGNATIYPTTGSSPIYLKGSFTVSSGFGGHVLMGSNTIHVGGNYSIDDPTTTLSGANYTIVLDGAVEQMVGGLWDADLTIPYLILNNGAYNIQLTSNLNVSEIYQHIIGEITPNGYHFTFPGLIIDDANDVDLDPITGGATITDYSASTSVVPVGDGGAVEGIAKRWMLDGTITGGTVVLTFTWDSADDNGVDWGTTVPTIFWSTTGVGTWNAVTPDSYDVVSNPRWAKVTTDHFSEWSVGPGDTTLPVEFSSFSASQTQNGFVTLRWTTQSETGMQGFMAYRSDTDKIRDAVAVSPMVDATNSETTRTYDFTDLDVSVDYTYFYWIECRDLDGHSAYHGPISITLTDTPGEPTPEPAFANALKPCFPNPFNPQTTVAYSVANDNSHVSLAVYNLKGQLVRNLYDGSTTRGDHTLTWNGTDHAGASCGSGTYFVRIQIGQDVFYQKASLMK